MAQWNQEEYIDVAERIREFKAAFPDGTLQSHVPPYVIEVGGKSFIVYCAAAYRTPDDERPGIGWAWEPVPGPTPFTKDSELQNSETSAWGRAIVALGFSTKHIASANEVRNRSGQATADDKRASEAQVKTIRAKIAKLSAEGKLDAEEFAAGMNADYGVRWASELTPTEADEVIGLLTASEAKALAS